MAQNKTKHEIIQYKHRLHHQTNTEIRDNHVKEQQRQDIRLTIKIQYSE